MPELEGQLVWDDDDLRPGMKKEGGLHSNLFDEEGKLQASARFVPDEGTSKGSQNHLVIAGVGVVAGLAGGLLVLLGSRVSARVGTGKGVLKHRLKKKRSGRPQVSEARAELCETRTDELGVTPESKIRPKMSKAEAQARLNAADALSAQAEVAGAFAEAQRRIVAEAEISDDVDLDQAQPQLVNHSQRELDEFEAFSSNRLALPAAELPVDGGLANPAASLWRRGYDQEPAPKTKDERDEGSVQY